MGKKREDRREEDRFFHLLVMGGMSFEGKFESGALLGTLGLPGGDSSTCH